MPGRLRIFWTNLISIETVRVFGGRLAVPQLRMPAGLKPYMNWTLRLLTGVGLISSLIAIPIPILSFGFAVALLGIEQFLERTGFAYAIIYMQPFPTFRYEPEMWAAMGYAFPEDREALSVVGPAFRSEEFANQFCSLLRSWNYGQKIDQDNNVCISFIIESPDLYSVYIYPNPRRVSVTEFFDEAEESLDPSQTYDHLVVQPVFARSFSRQDAMLDQFLESQRERVQFWLRPFSLRNNETPEMLWDIEPIGKAHLKFRQREELSGNDVEFKPSHFLSTSILVGQEE